MNHKKLFLIALILLAGVFIYSITNKIYRTSPKIENTVTNTQANLNPTSPPLGSAIAFKNFFVYFGKDQVLITSFEGQPNNKGGILKQLDYPELFRAEGGGEFFLTAKEIDDQLHNKQFVYISKNVFNHGAYSGVYGIIFDPQEGIVVYITPDELAMSSLGNIQFLSNNSVIKLESNPYFFYNSCISCKLEVLDYQSYDPKSKKFIPVNSSYKSDFQALLDQYSNVAETECSSNGKIVQVTQLQKMAGDNAKCDDSLYPGRSEKPPSDFITVGEFLKIKDSIQKVIIGEKQSMLSL